MCECVQDCISWQRSHQVVSCGASLVMQEQEQEQELVELEAEEQEDGEDKDEGKEEDEEATQITKTADSGEKRAGCSHYKRRAKFVTPCCNKFYMCRYCHDDNESHYFNRKSVTELICTECDTRQKVQAECEKCGVRFGKYTCLICNLFDDEDKKQYHCDGCGICRVGGREKFFHCAVCNMCLPVQLKTDGHRCVENVSRSNCPVCLEDIHTSRIPCHIPDCGHLLHRTCFEELLQSGHYACPTCQTSMIDMASLWHYLDSEVALTPMPEEYSEYKATILCKDCHQLSTVNFHVVGLKCSHCGAYNTCQTNGFHKGMEAAAETTAAEDSSDSPAQASSSDSAGSTSSAGQSTSASSSTTNNKACSCRTRLNSNPSETTVNGQLNESSESNEPEEEDQSHNTDDELPQPNISDEPPQA